MPLPQPIELENTYAEIAQPESRRARHIKCGGQDLKHTLLKDIRNGTWKVGFAL